MLEITAAKQNIYKNKNEKKKEPSLRDLWTVLNTNICIIGVPEG